MPPKHRAERGKSPRDARVRPANSARTAGTAAPRDAAPKDVASSDASGGTRRWPRRLAWIAAALVTSGIALVGLVLIGNRYNANLGFGEKRDFGATGQIIFERNCAICHGPAGQGLSGPAFTPGGPLSKLTFQERVNQIGDPNGLNTMPNWTRRGMSKEQLRMVAAYTQILSGMTPDPSVTGVR